MFKPVSVLSGGELSRLRLCMLMDEEINLLILDEPTNHLDIAAREWIEEAVEAFDGTLLFVSHDRYFIQRFATRIWELADGTITDYPMGFAQYRAVKAQEKAPQPGEGTGEKGDTRPPRGNRSQQAARRQLTICERGSASWRRSAAAGRGDGGPRLRCRGTEPALSGEAGGRGPAGAGNGPAGRSFLCRLRSNTP